MAKRNNRGADLASTQVRRKAVSGMGETEREYEQGSFQSLIVTGISGAGKTTAIKLLEDLGFFCVDNIPPQLLPSLFELVKKIEVDKIAVVLDIRSKEFIDFDRKELVSYIKSIKHNNTRVLYLTARDDVIVNRFKATRHHHPLTGVDIEKGIKIERELLEDVRVLADYVIDTSELSPWDLKVRLAQVIGKKLRYLLRIISFGFKYGLPRDSDIVIDVRFLPNPFYIPSLASKTGQDEKVKEHVLSEPWAKQAVEHLASFLRICCDKYRLQGKTSITVAIGCTGGKHRSVAVAEYLSEALADLPFEIEVIHRDIVK